MTYPEEVHNYIETHYRHIMSHHQRDTLQRITLKQPYEPDSPYITRHLRRLAKEIEAVLNPSKADYLHKHQR